jgi:aminoglycoside 3-N-acetyltransferase
MLKDILKLNTNKLLIHTDILRAVKLPRSEGKSFFKTHTEFIQEILDNQGQLYFPAFNYTCLKTGEFRVDTDPIVVGMFNEYLRQNEGYFRSETPVFSFISNKPILNNITPKSTIDPFDKTSLFDDLYNSKAVLLHYGSPFSSSTIIHYIERISNVLTYRYDKNFKINIINSNNIYDCTLKLHVRPMGLDLDYDWNRLQKDLIEKKILHEHISGRANIRWLNISDLVEYWLNHLQKDPLFLLNVESKIRVNKRLESLGRPFKIVDFE